MSRLRKDHGLCIGSGAPGPANCITDVPGVQVGHETIVAEDDGVCTGVTAVLPHDGDLYREKLPAAAAVINGYGKMTGLAQIHELGLIESPIVLTNTLGVGTAWDAVTGWMLERFDRPEDPILSINPVVAECNDSQLNHIRARAVDEHHVRAALDGASSDPAAEGCVGAGTGMTAFGWKSGVGTASRFVRRGENRYALGVLALPNFGRADQLTIRGVPVGETLPGPCARGRSTGGSIVVLVATDLPCDARQLSRLARRVAVGIARTGGTCDGTSGEFALAFSTAKRVPHKDTGDLPRQAPNDVAEALDDAFLAVVEATEEAILSALFAATPTVGHDGRPCPALPRPSVLALVGASRAA
ncbi:MAG: P1 family peptidase [Candidatus Bipolaricaulota bacterium]|nr:MAG: P1 family peptidase [Candidatus Bipolaricaulota bacterium]